LPGSAAGVGEYALGERDMGTREAAVRGSVEDSAIQEGLSIVMNDRQSCRFTDGISHPGERY
jgi:hypothetical protein